MQMFPDNPLCFFQGLIVGIMITYHWLFPLSTRARESEEIESGKCNSSSPGFGIDVLEAIKVLKSNNMINHKLSSTDNAKQALESLSIEKLSSACKACVVYAIHVLQSEAHERSIPLGLRHCDSDVQVLDALERTESIPSSPDPAIKQWILSNFTPIIPKKSMKKITLKKVAMGIRFAIRLRKVITTERPTDNEFIFEISDEELEPITRALDGVDEWNWSVWDLKEASKDRALQVLGWHLLKKWNVFETLGLDRDVVRCWLAFVEDMYEDNPYHNATHAADVLHAVHFFLIKGASAFLDQTCIAALLLTAMIHDAGHDGFNNIYHQNAVTERAILFNDQSIQENFHSMSIFRGMHSEPQVNVLACLSPDKAREIRRLMVMMILGTDMKHHFANLQDFQGSLKSLEPKPEAWASQVHRDKLCIILLHAADLSNPCRPFKLALKWAGLVLEEFFNQGDMEKELGLPISPLCSRDSTLMPASQIYFIVYVVQPTFQALCTLLPLLDRPILAALGANLKLWRLMDSAAACKDAPTLEKLQESSTAHRREGPRSPRGSFRVGGRLSPLMGLRLRACDSWRSSRGDAYADGAVPMAVSPTGRMIRSRRQRKMSAPDIFLVVPRFSPPPPQPYPPPLSPPFTPAGSSASGPLSGGPPSPPPPHPYRQAMVAMRRYQLDGQESPPEEEPPSPSDQLSPLPRHL